MKKTTKNLYIYWLASCVMFFNVFSVKARTQPDVLKVGDKAPSIHVFKWIKGNPISEFVKGKTYVVEFGATWCKPCAESIPHLTDLARKFSDDVSVMSVFVMEDANMKSTKNGEPPYLAKVEKYVARQGSAMSYNVAVDGPEKSMELGWLKASGTDGIPYTFVVDKNGIIAWIGVGANGLEEVLKKVTSPNYDIDDLLSEYAKQPEKTMYDETRLLLIDGNGGEDDDFNYRSVITKYKGDFKASSQMFVQNYKWASDGSREQKFQGRVQEIAAPLSRLYYMAYADTVWNWPNSKRTKFLTSYGQYWFEPLLEVADTTPFVYSSNSIANKYNYSLKVPVEKASARFLQAAMQRDLMTYFGYDVSVETRSMPCWILTATADARSKLATKTPGREDRTDYFDPHTGFSLHNNTIQGLIFILWGYTMNQQGGPIYDETGITGEIDLKIDTNILNLEELRAAFKSQGLSLEKSSRKMKVVVIRDRHQ